MICLPFWLDGSAKTECDSRREESLMVDHKGGGERA